MINRRDTSDVESGFSRRETASRATALGAAAMINRRNSLAEFAPQLFRSGVRSRPSAR
jgi:hypothetical protein